MYLFKELTVDTTLRKGLRRYGELRHQFDVGLIEDETGEFERQAKNFVARRPSWVKKNQKARIFTLNPEPFDPSNFIGAGWEIWRGPKNGDGCGDGEAQDVRSLAFSEFDIASIRFENMLNEEDGEVEVGGEEKIVRLKESKFIRLDARLGRDLIQEDGQETLEWLHSERGVSWFDLPGTILRSPGGIRCVLYLCRDERQWYWNADWIECVWDRQNPSAVLASS